MPSPRNGKLKGSTPQPERIRVRNETRDSLLAESVEVADTSAKRRKGLLGRDTLGRGEGLWIVPCEAIHTCGMRFPIDVLYLDQRRKVRKSCKAVAPWRLSLCLFAHSVLELPAGTIEQSSTRKGDQLLFMPLAE